MRENWSQSKVFLVNHHNCLYTASASAAAALAAA